MKRSEIFFSTILVPVDLLALLSAFLFSYYLRDKVTLLSPGELTSLTDRLSYIPGLTLTLAWDKYLHYLGYIIPVMLVIFGLCGLYRIRTTNSWMKQAVGIFTAVSIGEGFILFLFLLKKDFFIPRAIVIYSWILAFIFVLIGRLLVRLVQRYLYRFQIGVIQVAVVGKSVAADQLILSLKSHPSAAYKVAAHLDTDEAKKVTKELSQLGHLDEIIVVNDHYGHQELIEIRNFCLEQHIAFNFVPSLLTALSSTFAVRHEAGLPMIEVQPTPLEGWGRVTKRIFDLSVGMLALIVFSPLFLIISIWIKLASPGPLIYKHRRIGKNGDVIHIWKFRSMHWEYCTGVGNDGDAKFKELLAKNPALAKEWEETFKLKNDPRISAPGNFLRKTSLDELPQFWNVLTGALSLVGPRPIVSEEVRKYGEASRILFSVRPGITGLWQTSGRTDTSYAERIALDTEYIEHWNLWRDITILLKTGWQLIRRSGGGAY